MEENTLTTVKTGLQLSSIIAHVKENNVSYLLGLVLLHSMGMLTDVQTYAAGVCN